MFFSPLEQFQIYPLLIWGNFFFNNNFFTILNSFLLFFIFLKILFLDRQTFLFSKSNYHIFIENIYSMILSMIVDNIGKKGQSFFPFVYILFFFIIILNIIGLIPYNFTITSHLIITVGLSILIFIGVNIVCFKEHNNNMLVLFMPSGTSLELAFILIPIEIISYVFKPLSLSVRLFANMMAGHTLLKVINGFLCSLGIDVISLVLHIPYILGALLIIIFVLELAVGVIQAYVFTLLTCIYLNDAINLH